jgi:hypothetical protein
MVISLLSSVSHPCLDIISSKPRNRGIRKGKRGLRVNRAAAAQVTARQQQPTTSKAAAPGAAATIDPTASVFEQGSKIIVSNLVAHPQSPYVC